MRNCCYFRAYISHLILALGLCCAFAGLAMAQMPSLNHSMLAQAASYSSLGGNMAGYVLNAETDMNRIYTQKLNQKLLNPTDTKDGGPLIQYVGPPPQAPPIGPIYQRSTQARPLPRRGL